MYNGGSLVGLWNDHFNQAFQEEKELEQPARMFACKARRKFCPMEDFSMFERHFACTHVLNKKLSSICYDL